jgi:hypothetical protein
MRELMMNETNNVAGGTGAFDASRNTCRNNNLPANTRVTITVSGGGSVGSGSTFTSNGITTTYETTCGELLAPADFSGVSGGSSSSAAH